VSGVYVVALLALAGSVDDEAAALAADLGGAVYETRLVLAAGAPAVVLQTSEKERALGVLSRLRGRGHGAVACDDAAVVSSSEMIAMSGFRLEPGGLVNGDGERLAFEEILALIPAVHKRQLETRSTARDPMKDRQEEMGYGPVGRTVLRQVRNMVRGPSPDVSRTEQRDNVLYVFRKGNARPWLLRESGTSYAGLGPKLRSTAHENFMIATDLLRTLAPHAAHDARLLSLRRIPDRVESSGAGNSRKVVTTSKTGVDLLAHLLALSIARQSAPSSPP
jgi:hypothetical protein